MDKPAILSNPEAFVVVPVEPVTYIKRAPTHVLDPIGYQVCRHDRIAAFPVYARPDPTALADPTALSDIVAYCAALEAENARLRGMVVAAEEEFNRISCEGVTETRSVSDALDRAKVFADRGAVACGRTLKENGNG